MPASTMEPIGQITAPGTDLKCFVHTRLLSPEGCGAIEATLGPLERADPDGLHAAAEALRARGKVPAFFPDLLRLEAARLATQRAVLESGAFNRGERDRANPTLQVLEHPWLLAGLLGSGTDADTGACAAVPRPGVERVLLWRHPRDGQTYLRAARERDLLALKIVVEGHGRKEVAEAIGASVGFVDEVVREADRRGLILAARPRLLRDGAGWPEAEVPARLRVASSFTLQWHLTHACDLHCKHCYDRSKVAVLEKVRALPLLDDLWRFCDARKIRGHVSFSGGNPFFYPHLIDLYAAAVERGFETSILGNPVRADELEAIVRLQRPRYFQVSLEGLEAANDEIRGEGNFERVVAFLELCQTREVPTAVMLTLTRKNLEEMLPLAEHLAGKVDRLTFNRLSQVGEGKNLAAAPVEAYEAFLRRFVEAREGMPFLRMKDNLFNILRDEADEPLIGGCTGFGCGAAFNFLAVLPDGEAHACRKFPSPLGNVLAEGLEAIYEGVEAARYRRGCLACDGCTLRAACGGCLAVTHGGGADPFTTRDPYCFYREAP